MRFIYTKTFAKIFAVFVILALVTVLDLTGYIGIFKDGFLHAYGFLAVRVENVSTGVKDGFSTIFTIKNLAQDNAVLNQKIDQLSFENALLKQDQDENSALRLALSYKQK